MDSPKYSTPPAKMILLLSVADPVKLSLFQENLRSHAIEFEVRKGTELFVPENEWETAQAIIAEGNWEY